MTENTPAPKGSGGLFKKLTPKQKRYAVVIGAAAVLALVYLLQRRHAGGEAEGQSPSNTEAATAGATPIPATGATDPSAFLGAQSEGVDSALGEVSGSLGEVNSSLGEVLNTGEGLSSGIVSLSGEVGELRDAQKRTLAAVHKQGHNLTAIRKKLAGGGPGKNHRGHGGKPQGSGGKKSGDPAGAKKKGGGAGGGAKKHPSSPPKPQPKPAGGGAKKKKK